MAKKVSGGTTHVSGKATAPGAQAPVELLIPEPIEVGGPYVNSFHGLLEKPATEPVPLAVAAAYA